MFERYTEKARRVIFFARYEAIQFGSPYIETEHILLGLLRDDKALFHRLLPDVNHQSIHKDVEAITAIPEKILTSVDLPLSDASKRVLKYAAEEADRLSHRHIGTEHLLLGLLHETSDLGGQLLTARGAKLDEFRKKIEEAGSAVKETQRALGETPFSSPYRPFGPAEVIEIHGQRWNADYIRDAVQRCKQVSWHWHKLPWKARDVVVELGTGSLSFDLSLATGSTKFQLLKHGWKKDFCAICRWELLESKDDAEHGTGYTNGRDWVCLECYAKFFERDYFQSSYRDIT